MSMRKLNKKSLYQEGGMVSKDSIDPAIDELSKVVQARIESGEPAEQVLFSFLQEGMPQEQLALAFETVGYDPGLFTQLMQSVEQMVMQAQQQQEQPQPSEQELLQQLEQATSEEQQMMQWGGNTTARGPLESLSPGVPRPLYMPVVPRRGNLINAAYLASDAFGEMFSGEDRDGDGVMDGSFRDMKAKKARYKNKQLQNRTYEVDYGDLNPNDYVANWADLAEGKVKTKEEYGKDFFENSLIDFNPESGQYMGAFATRPEDYAMLGKKQKEQFGLLGPKKERKFSDPSSWFGREDAPIDSSSTLKQFVENLSDEDKTDLEMIREAMKYGPGRGLNLNRTSYDESILNPSQIKDSRSTYRDIMLGKASMKSEEPVFNFNQQEDFNAPAQRSIVQVPTEQSSFETPSREQQFKDWAMQNPVVRMTTAGRQEFDRLNPMRYGGDLPKAQYGVPYDFMQGFDPNNPMGLPDFSQMGQTSYINPATGMPWAPGPDASVAVNEDNPILLDEVVVTAQGTGGLKSKGLAPIPIQMPEMNLAPINFTIPTAPATVAQQPTVKRKRSLGNAFNQVETFIKDNPAMRAFGDASQAAVMGANFLNEWFQEKEFQDYRNKLRNSTMADKAYLATTNPSNKRGTFDVNLGLAEPDNLVDYYAQAMYGKEMYKSGGQFKPHMMYDPETKKAYKASKPEDHERMAKMGYTHELPKAQWGLTDVLNSINSSLGGSDTYWDKDRSFSEAVSDGLNELRPQGGWLGGQEGWIPDELTFNKPTKRQLQTLGAVLTSPKNWSTTGKSPLKAMLQAADIPGGDLLYNITDPLEISQYYTLPNYNQYNSFDEAFAAARKDLGKGASFMYGDTRYTTNYEGEAPNDETQAVLDYVTEGLSPEQKERLMQVYKKAGQPPISFEKDTDKYSLPIYGSGSWADISSGSDVRRPHVNLLGRDNPVYINKRSTIPYTRNLLLDELSHNMQIRNDGTGTSLWRFGTDAAAGKLFGHSPYHKEGAFEHEAHERIQPLLLEYVNQGGRFPDLDFANGGELEVDNDTLAALIAAGADIEML